MRDDVKRDDMWGEAQEKAEKVSEEQMREQVKELEDYTTRLEGEVLESGPSETDLVIIALLMRIYDLNLALLSHFNKPQADEVYEAHAKGDHFNPKIYIPRMEPDGPVETE